MFIFIHPLFPFRKVKTLAEEDWLDDTTAWVEKSRKLAKEKELAEKRVSDENAVDGGMP